LDSRKGEEHYVFEFILKFNCGVESAKQLGYPSTSIMNENVD
jgi:hypothetical protein